jgi:hypothetical protein
MWLNQGETLTIDHFRALIVQARRFPESNDALERALSSLGMASADELFPLIDVMAQATTNDAATTDGHADRMHWSVSPPRQTQALLIHDPLLPDDEVRALLSSQQAASGGGSSRLGGLPIANESMDRRPGGLTIVTRTSTPGLCIQSGATMYQALLLFTHEMIHLAELAGAPPRALESYNSADEYVAERMTGPGGETQAYLAQTQLEHRLRSEGMTQHQQSALLPLLNDAATDWRSTTDVIAELNRFANYDEHYRSGFRSSVESSLTQSRRTVDYLTTSVLPVVEENARRYQQASLEFENYAIEARRHLTRRHPNGPALEVILDADRRAVLYGEMARQYEELAQSVRQLATDRSRIFCVAVRLGLDISETERASCPAN